MKGSLSALMGKSRSAYPEISATQTTGLLNPKVLVLNEVHKHPDEDFSNSAVVHRLC